jgi:hypothetical protein
MLLLPEDEGYDTARRIHNASIDKRPALIARCLGTADVLEAVAFARTSGSRSPYAAAATTLPDARSATAA